MKLWLANRSVKQAITRNRPHREDAQKFHIDFTFLLMKNYHPVKKSIAKPNILLIDNSRHLTGAFASAIAIIDALKSTYNIEILLPATSTLRPWIESKEVVCHQMPIVEIGRAWSKLFRYLPQLIVNTISMRRLLSRRKINILIVNDYYNLLGFTVKITGWQGRLITMVRFMPSSQQVVLNRIWIWAMRFSDKVGAVSKAVYDQLPRSKKIEIFYNPAWVIEKYSDRYDELFSSGIVNCLYLANYIRGKGHDYAIDAFFKAYKVNNTLRLRFVGGDMGLEKNRIWKEYLHEKTKILGIDDFIFFDDFSKDIEKDIKNSDIVLNFSISESFSQTCFEASAFGRPVIATSCGGPTEIIEDGVSGLLVPVGDVQAMAEALIKLSKDKELRLSMGNAGKSIVAKKFSQSSFLTAFDKLAKS